MGVHASSPMPAIAVRTWLFISAVTDKYAPARRTVPANAAEQDAESASTTSIHPVDRG